MPINLGKSLRKRSDLIKFFYVQRSRSFTVPDSPHFDEPSTAFFLNALEKAEHYLEYGSGGSTVIAAKLAKNFTSVDSDRYFLESVVKKIQDAGTWNPQSQHYLHADIGLTKQWGKPFFENLTDQRTARWASYSEIPWNDKLRRNPPELVLIDGRFRVACALTSVKHLYSSNVDWTILVDDYCYNDKFRYREIESFATLEKMVGRMAVFSRKEGINLDQLDVSIKHHQTIHI